MRRRAAQRQIHRSQDRERERQRDDERGQPSVSRAARYLESGLVDPREASRPMLDSSAPARDRQLRAPSDTSNPFTVSWGSRRVLRAGDEEDGFAHPGTRRSRSRSQSRDGSTLDWLAHMVPDEGPTLHEWISEARPSRSANPRAGASGSGTYDEREELDHSQRSGESPSSYAVWRARSSGTWQPRLAVSPQSTAQPARTPAHARAQSIPTSSLSSFSSMTGQPAVHRLRSRPPRTAGVGSANSLVAENAAALRRREARAELMERLNHTMSVDISDPESDWDSPMTRRARDPPPMVDRDDEMDSDEESHTAPLPRRVAEAIEMIEARPPPRLIRYRRPSDTSSPLPPRLSSSSLRSRSSAGRGAFEQDAEEQTNASSSGLNTRRPPSIRRTIPLLRPHPISGEISPPPPPSASVNRRHVSWEAPSRDTGVSSTYQYLSALSHGFDSQSLSISDLAHTIASNSNSEALRSSPSSPWGDHESPFSTLFARTAGASSSRHSPHNTRSQAMPGGYPDDTMEAEDSGIPSLPPPDLGGDFERTEDMLRSANTGGTRASSAMDNPISESPISNIRPPPSHNPYTGPFRLTMQRREEYSRQRLAASQRRIPDPPSIPPLHFGAEFDNPPSLTPPEERSDSRVSGFSFE
ncbi:hypothetical protein B0H11DRAFT_1022260 [Mycena galericulata]|nr:hypothetical protein B0H11DRAFT_1022260 [Mycena galericulata]